MCIEFLQPAEKVVRRCHGLGICRCLLVLFALCPSQASASEEFVEANIIGIFYHELGHAIIDIEEVPIFGQEEDAADVFSIFLIDALFEEQDSLQLAYDVAIGFWSEAILRQDSGDSIAWWGVHGIDEQRFYNTVCIFYGAYPEERQGFIEDMELPEERAETCPDEFDQANAAWGGILDELEERGPGASFRFDDNDGSLTAQLIAEEVEVLNGLFSISQPLNIVLEDCGEANAFYDPGTLEVIFCSEFEDHLWELAK